MPRPLVYGNGRLLVQLDSKGRIRDFFWPQVGIRNHVAGHYHHMGIFENGRFSWFESDEWNTSQRYLDDGKTGQTRFESGTWGLVAVFQDSLGEDFFHRTISVRNLADRDRKLELFFSQDFRIAESEIGDTAMYVPNLDSMVHFKWNYYFACRAWTSEGGIHQKTVGLRGINGLQGTWRDAEDGVLLGKPIEQGAVDSTISTILKLPADGEATAQYRIYCAESLDGLFQSPKIVHRHGNTSPSSHPEILPESVRNLADVSLQILKSQIDYGGGILAANDSDIMQSNRANYSYVWPRDGALVARVLDREGEQALVGKYQHFASKLITHLQPFFLQKYNVDGTLGATWHPWTFDGVPEVPLQEDETALSLWSFCESLKSPRRDEWLTAIGPDFVEMMADFLCVHVDEHGLPKPSYDLWEERRGVHTFTVATVIAGLRAAGQTTKDESRATLYSNTAAAMLDSMLKHLVDHDTGVFLRGFRSTGYSSSEADRMPDASLLLVGRFAGLAPDHPVVKKTNEWIEKELWVNSPIGGLARYPGDYYARVSERYPGNPWVITTMWLTQEKIRAATSRKDLNRTLELLEWTVERGGSTGVLGEQFHPETGEVMTVSPLTWSHSEFLATCLDWAEKYNALAD